MNDQKRLVLLNQLLVARKSLEEKYASSNESIIYDYIKLYEDAISSLKGNWTVKSIKILKGLKGCARGYLETSSDYNQIFLREMSLSEKLIKELLDES